MANEKISVIWKPNTRQATAVSSFPTEFAMAPITAKFINEGKLFTYFE